MWNSRDRLLAGMFAVQLLAAIVFGGIVAASLSSDPGTQVLASDGTTTTAEGTSTTTDGTAGGAGATGASGTGTGTSGATPTGGSGDPAGATEVGGGAADAVSQDAGDPGTAGGDGGEAAAATSGEGNRTGVTDDEIRIGVLVTQTGAINFRSSAQATKAYIDMVNEQGGVHGRKIRAIIKDDGLDPNRGQQAVQEMLNAGVFSFVSFNAPLTEQSILPELEKNKIPLIGAFSIPSHPWGYIFSALYETYGRVGGQMLCDNETTTPGLVYISNQVEETDRIIAESWRLGLENCGLELPEDNVHGVDVTKADFSDVVTQLQLAGVDGLGTILDATAMVRLQQAMNRQGYAPLHVSSPFGGDPAVLDNPNVGESFEGTFVLSDVEFLGSSVPEVQRYEQEVSRRFGGDAELNWAGQHGWLGTSIFVKALERIGPDPTREKLMQAMNSWEDLETGFTVPLTITEDPATHNTANLCMKVGKVVNGKVQQVRDWQCPEHTLQVV